MALMATAQPIEICPRCGFRDIDNERTGFCSPCSGEDLVERYSEVDRERTDHRRNRWRARTSPSESQLALRIRQRRHRLEAGTRPKEFPDPSSDPLDLAATALRHLSYVQGAVRSNVRTRGHIEQVAEIIKQLAHGPAED